MVNLSQAIAILTVTKVRGVQPQQLETLINQNTDDRFLGIFGEPGVNVLKLNLALADLAPKWLAIHLQKVVAQKTAYQSNH
ncbi:hypothetical protein NIES592_21950 [Fischerella major NIES-592]|uniref:Uncharacterized protein n=1 Tax=Fischerella major NIES-592 TaxID=210994 RepID=A0A1U7GTS8_9CYAN|nr:hypothetical protein NIES592_21950 [Fischerella major NIES-592]